MEVILIEDDPGISDALQMVFERAGISVTAYLNGNAILNNTFQMPDIFIIDKQLAGVDGLDICRYLKGRNESNKIPVIIVSASPATANLAVAAGADAFVEKPFKNKDLLEKINALVAKVG